ncbi:MAG: acetate--CoA ligase family protein [Burkholderiaceae bacterium]
MRFMRRHGFAGRILPVNPARATVLGEPAWSDLASIGVPIDHAYILLDTEAAVDALLACAAARVKVVTVLADGFAEAGPAGQARQARLAAIAHDAGMLLIGPNSTGLVDTRSGFSCTTNAAFATDPLVSGRLAVISQSGSLIGTLYSRGAARAVGYSTLVSVGNEALFGVGEIGDLLLDDPGHDGFVLFMETIRRPDALAAFARRAHALGRPVLCYLVGRSDEGRALSVSHTGAMTGSGRASSSFLRSHGIIEVENFETLFEAPRALLGRAAIGRRPRQVTVLTTTGGGGAMVVDRLGERGVPIAGCSPAARATLQARGIPLGNGKLVDVTLAGARYESMKSVVSTLIADPDTGALVITIGSSAQFQPEIAVRPLIDALAEAPADAAPVLAFPLPHAEQSLKLLAEAGIPAFLTLESCAESVAILMQARSPDPPAGPVDERDTRAVADRLAAQGADRADGLLTEVQSSAVFEVAGIPVPPQVYLPGDQPLPDRLPFGFPVVAKLVSAQLPHKSEVGAIRVGLRDGDALHRAIAAMRRDVARRASMAKIDGVLVQAMLGGVQEMLVGLTRDPLVGPVVTVGIGGTATEIYRDTTSRPAPVSPQVAAAMLRELRGFPLLDGFRGRASADLDALAGAIVAVSRLATVATIQEAEINPLLVLEKGRGVVLLDALIRVEPTKT